MYGAQIPSFTLRGGQAVTTNIGGCISLLIKIVASVFAVSKLKALIQRQSPSINTNLIVDALTPEDKFSMANPHFNIAFGMKMSRDNYVLDDPRVLKWVGKYSVTTNSKKKDYLIPTHECTDADFARFKEPSARSKQEFETFKSTGGLRCIDLKKEDLEIYGSKNQGSFAQLALLAVPCHVRESRLVKRSQDYIRDDCIWDYDEAIKVIRSTSVDFVLIYNDAKFNHKGFNDESVTESSTIAKVRLDAGAPMWTRTMLNQKSLEDETDYLQYG